MLLHDIAHAHNPRTWKFCRIPHTYADPGLGTEEADVFSQQKASAPALLTLYVLLKSLLSGLQLLV